MKHILTRKGLWLTAGSVLFLIFLFLVPYPQTIVRIPSPEFEVVRRFYWYLMMAGCGFLLCLGAVLWISPKTSFWVYPGTLLVLGMFYMMVLTPFSAPDEAAHFISAYRLSNQMMGKTPVASSTFFINPSDEEKERIRQGANVLVRRGDDVPGLYKEVGQASYKMVLSQLFSKDHSQGVTVREEIPVNTSPVVYLPQAIGITFARLLHLGYIPLIILGRFFNLLAFISLAALSVSVMPFKKELLMAVSGLPMTLHLAASFSYDAAFIGLSMLLLAWCFHLAYEKKQVTVKDVVFLTLLLVLLEPGKIVYLPVAGICLLIPASKFQSKKHYWLSVISAVAVMVLAVFFVNRVILSAWAVKTEGYVGWSQATGYTLQDVLHQPYHVFMVYYETVITQFDYYMVTMLGGFLGNLDPDLTVPPVCLALLWLILIVSSIRRENEKVFMTGRQKLWILFLVFLSIGLVLASMLLGWTPKEMTYITGVQGRYFIPLLPLVLLTIFDRRLVLHMDGRKTSWYLICFVNIYALIRICSTACLRP